MGDDQQVASQQQDVLRPLRMFVNALQAGLGSNQSYAGTDSTVVNPPGQFVIVGTNGGQAVEGQPIFSNVGVSVPAWLLWVGVGAIAYKFLKG